ncbi:MAG TPA: cupin domain-containing protein [Steroidobacteraceae bacterium]|nr:cupin domain-containing protein [Steroidobacteraceae bacterium]
MRYVRPFDIGNLKKAHYGDWLLALSEGTGVSVRPCRGGGEASPTRSAGIERYALVIEGEARLVAGNQSHRARRGELIFIPAGIPAAVTGDGDTVWAEIEAPVADSSQAAKSGEARVIPIDQSKFEGQGFAYQSLIDRTGGAQTLRMNVLQVQPGAGSPDYHIHAFAQIYLIQEGEMTIDVGRKRLVAGANSLVVLPPGVVHRNFNSSGAIERHVSLLVPEPREGEIFDFAVTIHDKEAELLRQIPA